MPRPIRPYEWYIVSIIGFILFIILSLPAVDRFFCPYVPDDSKRLLLRGLLFLILLFLTCNMVAWIVRNYIVKNRDNTNTERDREERDIERSTEDQNKS